MIQQVEHSWCVDWIFTSNFQHALAVVEPRGEPDGLLPQGRRLQPPLQWQRYGKDYTTASLSWSRLRFCFGCNYLFLHGFDGLVGRKRSHVEDTAVLIWLQFHSRHKVVGKSLSWPIVEWNQKIHAWFRKNSWKKYFLSVSFKHVEAFQLTRLAYDWEVQFQHFLWRRILQKLFLYQLLKRVQSFSTTFRKAHCPN